MIKNSISLPSNICIEKFLDINIQKNNNERQCRSTPGHLLHWVYKGNYELLINGIHYHAKKDDFIYYYNCEDVYWLRNPVEVCFYSLSFQMPSLQPIDKHNRVFTPSQEALSHYKNLKKILRAKSHQFQNERILAHLLNLIAESFNNQKPEYSLTPWTICEQTLISKNIFRSNLEDMCKISKVSQATLARSCNSETGTSPLSRLKQLRMDKAINLVRHSTMRIGEIASHLSYDRIHEFSREFTKHFNHSPKKERAHHFK